MRHVGLGRLLTLMIISSVSSLILGCSHKSEDAPSAAAKSCTAIAGTPWVPNVASISASNHGSAAITKNVYTGHGLLTGISQAYTNASAHVVTISGITMDQDLGTRGSMSLVAEVTNYPTNAELAGGRGFPALISLTDSAGHELVNVTGCNATGVETCTTTAGATSCYPTLGCSPKSPTAFLGNDVTSPTAKQDINSNRRSKWEEQQRIFENGNFSVNTFPTCNWTPTGDNNCAFNSNFFVGGKLAFGATTYTAKYLMLTDFLDVADSYGADLKLTVVRKQDSGAAGVGAIDLNVVLVGTKNITASHTDKGKQNLDALFTHVVNHYGQTSPGIKIGAINVYEWGCESSGDDFANSKYSVIGKTFATGSKLVSSDSETKAINIFLVSKVPYDGGGTILGIAGGITAAPINGLESSGAAFSSFDKLDTYNPKCTGSGTCDRANQDADFIQMGSTIGHEMGHFLGLNHPTEADASDHDRIPDTPVCTFKDANGRITNDTCATQCVASGGACPNYSRFGTLCPSEKLCQFNHIMWWTSKYIDANNQMDGNQFSANSATLIRYNPYVQ